MKAARNKKVTPDRTAVVSIFYAKKLSAKFYHVRPLAAPLIGTASEGVVIPAG